MEKDPNLIAECETVTRGLTTILFGEGKYAEISAQAQAHMLAAQAVSTDVALIAGYALAMVIRDSRRTTSAALRLAEADQSEDSKFSWLVAREVGTALPQVRPLSWQDTLRLAWANLMALQWPENVAAFGIPAG